MLTCPRSAPHLRDSSPGVGPWPLGMGALNACASWLGGPAPTNPTVPAWYCWLGGPPVPIVPPRDTLLLGPAALIFPNEAMCAPKEALAWPMPVIAVALDWVVTDMPAVTAVEALPK